MSIKANIEAIVYAAEEPVTFEQIFALIKEETRQELARKRREAASQSEAASPASSPEQQCGDQECPPEAEPGLACAEDNPEGDGAAPISANPSGANQESAETSTGITENSVAEERGAQETEACDERAQVTEAEAPHCDAPIPSGEAVPETADGQQSGNPAVPPEPPEEPSRVTDAEVKSEIRARLEELIADYAHPEHGIEIRQIAGGYRMATKPEQHESVRAFAKSLKPPLRLSLQALETLAVIAYKQPVTVPEISEIRGVEAGGVIGTLLDRKLITTAGRKQVIGRPIVYKTTKEFLLRFGLKDLSELPSMEEFEKLAAESLGADLFPAAPATPPEHAAPTAVAETSESEVESRDTAAVATESVPPEGAKGPEEERAS